MSIKGLLILTLSVTSLISSDAILIGGKCPTVEYFMAYGSCLGEYIRGMIEAASSQKGGLDAITKYHIKTCNNALITKTIGCLKRVNNICDYSLISTTLLTKATEILCDRHAVIKDMKNCSFDVTQLINCAKAIVIDTKNPICSATSAINGCMSKFVSPCSANVKKIISDLIGTVAYGRCTAGTQESGKCTLMSYVISVAGCYASFGANLADVIKENIRLNYTVPQHLAAVCKIPSINRGLTCHHEVDERCALSLMDAKKMLLAWNSVCSNVNEIVSIGNCFDASNYRDALQCLTEETKKTNDPCKLIVGVKTCLKRLYSKCPAGIKSYLDDAYGIVVPSTCDNTNSKTKCSQLSYLAGMALCWGPGVIGAVNKILGEKVDLGQTSCAADVLTRGKACHESLNKKCNERMIKANHVENILKIMCSDEKVFGRFPDCIRGVDHTFYTSCTKLNILPNGVQNVAQMCGLITNMRECLMKPFMGEKCHASVPTLMNTVMDAASKPDWCKPAHAASIHQSVLSVSLVAVMLRVLF